MKGQLVVILPLYSNKAIVLLIDIFSFNFNLKSAYTLCQYFQLKIYLKTTEQ